MGVTLAQEFYRGPTVEVAKDLLGKFLVREFKDGKRLVGKIVEVEAYDGPEDLACHASHGRTERTEVMFGPAGHAYIYLIYGIYHCLNFVTEKPGAAVLLRALAPAKEEGSALVLQGQALNSARAWPLEPSPGELAGKEIARIASGPGKLCQWMKIDKSFNGWDLTKGEKLWVEDHSEASVKEEIVATKRIGVAYAGGWAEKPWRFYIKDNNSVSRP